MHNPFQNRKEERAKHMQKGIVIHHISNQYIVEVEGKSYVCFARGKMKQQDNGIVVGDMVELEVQEEKQEGVIVGVEPRKHYSKRPKIANLTQMVFVLSLKMPKPDLLLLDKQLAYANFLGIRAVICINKIDLDTQEVLENIQKMYQAIGYPVITTNAKEKEGIETLKEMLKNQVTAFAGNSGVGKSTLINAIFEEEKTQEGMVSQKIKRGKNTTTAITLYSLKEGGYIADTPGFSTFDIEEIEAVELSYYFKEFEKYIVQCEFVGCSHQKEQQCGIKQAVENGEIAKERYERYCKIYQELKEKEAHKW